MKLHIQYKISSLSDDYSRLLNMTELQSFGSCLSSLIKSLDILDPQDWHITFFTNFLNEEASQFIKSKAPLSSIQTAASYGNLSDDIKDNDWIYFCNEDCLHDHTSFLPRFLDFVSFLNVKKFALPVFYHPIDHPNLYSLTVSRSYIFQTLSGYIREVFNPTLSFMCEAETYRKFSKQVEKEESFASILKNKAFCLGPLPGTVTDIRKNFISRYTDWEKIIYSSFK